MINVGGRKVYPTDVECVIQEDDNVAEVVVYGERNPMIGHIVCARVRLKQPEDPEAFSVRIRQFCRERIEAYKVPMKVALTEEHQYSSRFKKEVPT